jgi:hypothetical protein
VDGLGADLGPRRQVAEITAAKLKKKAVSIQKLKNTPPMATRRRISHYDVP